MFLFSHNIISSVPIVVGFESTVYTTSESEGMVELSVVLPQTVLPVTDPSMGGAPRPFSLLLSTKDGTASKTVLLIFLSITYVDAFFFLLLRFIRRLQTHKE